jgi:hypothetical protein
VYASVNVVPDANANANAPVYDRVDLGATVDVRRRYPRRSSRMCSRRG